MKVHFNGGSQVLQNFEGVAHKGVKEWGVGGGSERFITFFEGGLIPWRTLCGREGAVRRIEVEEVWCGMNCMKIGKAIGPSGVAMVNQVG